MSWTYSCPKCGGVVNPDETVILLAERGGIECLLGFHPAPGNYTLYSPPGVDVSRGDAWNFFCPICRESLAASEHANLCALTVWQGHERRRVLFSRIAGEQATYIVQEEVTAVRRPKPKPQIQTIGQDANKYENTAKFVIPPEFQQDN